MSRRKEPAIPNELLDQLLAGGDAGTALSQGGLLDALKKALTERALNAEMDQPLAGDDGAGNSRNGYGRKTITTGKLAIDVPPDRQASFDPQLAAKYQRRFPGFAIEHQRDVVDRAKQQSAYEAAEPPIYRLPRWKVVRQHPPSPRASGPASRPISPAPSGVRRSATGAFLMRGLEKVRAGFSLTALAYNLRRAINLVSVQGLIRAVRT